MHVSGQATESSTPRDGPRARMQKLMLETADAADAGGRVPSVSDVAEAAEVSRATAYRYFPTQAAMVQAAVDEALGPILGWRSDSARRRGADRGAARLRLSAHRRNTRRRFARRCCRRWTNGPAPGRHAGRRDANRARQPQRCCWPSAAGPLADSVGPRRFDRLAQVAVAGIRHRGLHRAEGIWGLDGEDARAWRMGGPCPGAGGDRRMPKAGKMPRKEGRKSARRRQDRTRRINERARGSRRRQ